VKQHCETQFCRHQRNEQNDNEKNSLLIIMAMADRSPRAAGTVTGVPCRFRFIRRASFAASKSILILSVASIPALWGFLFAALAFTPARAGGNIEVTYRISYLGITIGAAKWDVVFTNSNYLITASGKVKGMMSVLINGQGSGTARGELKNGRLTPSTFDANVTSTAEDDNIRMTLGSGVIKNLVAEPPFAATPKRVPLTEDVLRGVIDPLTATLRVAQGFSVAEIAPDACAQNLPIFDGRRRYDVDLAFKRTEDISIGADYQGTAFVCSVHLVPIAGQQVDSSAIQYLIKSNNIEISFVSIPGASALVPISASVPTLIGTVHVNPEGIETTEASPH
jgi:hypothetical protein